jgi:hypothetical protein
MELLTRTFLCSSRITTHPASPTVLSTLTGQRSILSQPPPPSKTRRSVFGMHHVVLVPAILVMYTENCVYWGGAWFESWTEYRLSCQRMLCFSSVIRGKRRDITSARSLPCSPQSFPTHHSYINQPFEATVCSLCTYRPPPPPSFKIGNYVGNAGSYASTSTSLAARAVSYVHGSWRFFTVIKWHHFYKITTKLCEIFTR